MIRRIGLAPVLAFVALLASAAPFAAAQDAEEIKALLLEVSTAAKAKDADAVAAAVKKVPDMYKGTEDKALRGKLVGELGKVLKNKKLGNARFDALAALVELEDPKAAWKYVSKAMPHPKKVDEGTELHLAAIEAAGRLAQKGAIGPLLDLAQKSKDNKLAAAAAQALGGYKDDKKNRVKIFVELISIGVRTRPGQTTQKPASATARARWQAVAPGLIKALNDLTGGSERDFESWETAYKENKKKPKALFKDD